MCGSAVFLYLGAEDAGINKGIRKVRPQKAPVGVEAARWMRAEFLEAAEGDPHQMQWFSGHRQKCRKDDK